MPASMITACVALSPKVTGSKIEMPAKGPMPGNTPTSVPTRQPIKAYQRLSGWKAMANPCARLIRVLSTQAALVIAEHAGRKRRPQHVNEREVSHDHNAGAVGGRAQNILALDDDHERDHHQDHGDEEAEHNVERDREGRDDNALQGMPAVVPGDRGEGRALTRAQEQQTAEQDDQDGNDPRQEAGARHRQLAVWQVAAQDDDQKADRDEESARDG